MSKNVSRRKKNRRLRSAAENIRKGTGYGGLDRVIAQKNSSKATEKQKALSHLKQNPTIKRFADVMFNDIDGGMFGAEIVDFINKDEKSRPAFNENFDIFLDQGRDDSIKGNLGEVYKTHMFAPRHFDLLRSKEGSPPPASSVDSFPNPETAILTVIKSKHYDTSPATAMTPEIEIFANAIPTVEFSRCVPYLDIILQSGVAFVDNAGVPTGLSLGKILIGPETAKGASLALATAHTENLAAANTGRSEKSPKILSEAGMEIFTTPQSLRPLASEKRVVPILDPSRPFMSIESFDVSVVPAFGLQERTTAKLNLILHDRSRLSEISELVRPENYATNELLIEYGWSHPDTSGRNDFANFLNATRRKEKWTVVNSQFSLDGSAQVKITLDLFAKGCFESVITSVLENTQLKSMGKTMAKAQKAILNYIDKQTKGGKKKRAKIKPEIFIEDHVNNLTNLFDKKGGFTDLISALEGKNKNTSLKASSEYKEPQVKELIGKIKDLQENFKEYNTKKSDLMKSIIEKITGTTNDPFYPAEDNPPQDTQKKMSVSKRDLRNQQNNLTINRKGDYISIGKLFSTFVGRPLAATERFDEVQMIFYPFASSSGFNGNLQKYNISEFLVSKDEFKQALEFMIENNSSAAIPIETFINFMIQNFIQYPGAPQAGGDPSDPILNKKLTRRGRRNPQQAESNSKEAQEQLKKERQKEIEALRDYVRPQVNLRFETVPHTIVRGTSADVTDRKSILKVHVFDRNCGRMDMFEELLASTNSLTSMRNYTSTLRKENNSKPSEDEVPEDLQSRSQAFTELQREINNFRAGDNRLGIEEIQGSPGEYRVNLPFDRVKEIITNGYPTLTYGSDASVFISAGFSSIQQPGFRDLMLRRYGKDPAKTASGASFEGLPVKVQPADANMTILGCPFLKYAQHFFIDFGTGTSADDMYYIKSLSHTIRPGQFTTTVQMSTRDADGKFESLFSLLKNATAELDKVRKREANNAVADASAGPIA